MCKEDLNKCLKNVYKDNVFISTTTFVILFSCFFGIYINLLLGIFVIVSFFCGCVVTIVLLYHQKSVLKILEYTRDWLGYGQPIDTNINSDCEICGKIKCSRHLNIPSWKGLYVDRGLDEAVDCFYTRILTSFVESWFSLLTKDEDFVQALKQNLREATCRLIIKLKEINAPDLITNKLLPCIFSHYEIIRKLLDDGIPLDKLAKTVVLNEHAIHPAVLNRQTEMDYLRSVSTFLIPRLSSNENFDSKVFFSLVRELLTCWVLLPLLDVVSDPNLINLLIIVATNKTNTSAMKKPLEKVIFLDKFARRNCSHTNSDYDDQSFLSDQTQLYSFMQFLKKDGDVDLLRFYLDVDSLNHDLLDPKLTTDPAKLSALFQQSEKLLKTYQAMTEGEVERLNATTLIEAHEGVKRTLQEKWKNVFHKTPEYFRLKYGSNELQESEDVRPTESQSVFRLGSKLKGAIRGGTTTVEATEVPTVWDAFTDEPPRDNSNNIYSSVALKLRKERGQNLENVVSSFMQSIEPNTDIGEDVILMNDSKKVAKKPQPPGRNFVFGDLLELKYSSKYLNQTVHVHSVRGPSQCLIYILVKILKTPIIAVRFVMALIHISRKLIDRIINRLIDKLIRIGLYEPRLTVLINELESQLFGPKQPDPSMTELLERQRQAKLRLEKVSSGLGKIADILQSPALNKHLMYSLFDIIVLEIYPELEAKE